MSKQAESNSVISVWRRIEKHLEIKRGQIYEQIKSYPLPIPACDAQFNHLLGEREKLGRELRRMHEVANESLTRSDAMELINEFVNSSSCLDEKFQRRIRASLKMILPR